MPSKPKKLCAYPGCPELTTERYCQKHRRADQKRYDNQRGTAAQRGYDETWREVRKRLLCERPLCEECLKAGIVRPAITVHHIVPLSEGGARLDYDNLMPLCRECHERIHQRKG